MLKFAPRALIPEQTNCSRASIRHRRPRIAHGSHGARPVSFQSFRLNSTHVSTIRTGTAPAAGTMQPFNRQRGVRSHAILQTAELFLSTVYASWNAKCQTRFAFLEIVSGYFCRLQKMHVDARFFTLLPHSFVSTELLIILVHS